MSVNQERKRRLRLTLLKYQKVCCWCGKPMQNERPNQWDYASIEHLQPQSLGGKTRGQALRTAMMAKHPSA